MPITAWVALGSLDSSTRIPATLAGPVWQQGKQVIGPLQSYPRYTEGIDGPGEATPTARQTRQSRRRPIESPEQRRSVLLRLRQPHATAAPTPGGLAIGNHHKSEGMPIAASRCTSLFVESQISRARTSQSAPPPLGLGRLRRERGRRGAWRHCSHALRAGAYSPAASLPPSMPNS